MPPEIMAMEGFTEWLWKQLPVVVLALLWVGYMIMRERSMTKAHTSERERLYSDLKSANDAKAEMAKETATAMATASAAIQGVQSTVQILISRSGSPDGGA